MKRFVFAVFILNSSFLISFAGGFQVNLQGQKQTGMGHTGTGFLTDASTILFNPGALIFLDSVSSINAGASFIFHNTEYLEPAPGIYHEYMDETIGTPFTLYAAYKIKPWHKYNFGLGVYTPFGSRVVWPDNWKGQFIIREINLKTIFIQPTFSCQINKKLSVGGGPIIATGSFALRKGIPIQDTAGVYGEAKLDGNASGYGFNMGIYFRPDSEHFSFGIDFRSGVKVNVKSGDAEFTVAKSLADTFPATTFSSSIRLPFVTTLGGGYHFNKKLSFALDINYIGWSSYDSLIIDLDSNNTKLQDIHSARKYKNSFIFRIGSQYVLHKNVTLRAGAYYDITPVQDGYLTPETPDANRIGISTGATIYLADRLNVDFSLLYIEGMKRTDTNLETGFSGTYKTKAVVPGIGLNFLF